MSKSGLAMRSRAESAPPAPRFPQRSVILSIVVIIAAGLIVYANSLRGPFLFDDIGRILQNEEIRSFFPLSTHLTHRRPIVSLSLTLNYAISGYDVRSYHVFNVAVHILAALALFGVVRRTPAQRASKDTPDKAPTCFALIVALIWVVHPLATQPVNYIIQRGESLMGLFYLLTIYGVLRGANADRSARWYGAAVIACALGMASKAVMVTAPVVVLIYDRIFVSPSFTELFRRRWMLYMGLAATWAVLLWCGIVQTVLSPANVGNVGLGYKGITPGDYALTQLGVVLHYLELSLWPSHLVLDYVWQTAASPWVTVLQGMLMLTLLGGTIWALFRRPAWGFLGAWFFIILSPTSSIIPIKDPIFEHRMYLPLMAVVCAVVSGADALLRFLFGRMTTESGSLRMARIGLVVVAVGALGWRTIDRNRDYRSRAAMWESVVTLQPHSARAYCNLGVALSEESGQVDEAVAACRKAVELDPVFVSGHFRLGQVLNKAGATAEAVAAFREAIRLDSRDTDAHYSLANALFQLRRFEEAAAVYRRTLHLDPRYVSAAVNLGNTLRAMGRPEEALDAYRQAVETAPDFPDAHFNLGVVLAEQSRLEEALAAFRRTIALDPRQVAAHRALGNALYSLGRLDEAVTAYTTARRLAPDHPGAYFNLGNVWLDMGEYDQAIEAFQQVLRLSPDFGPAREALNRAVEAKRHADGTLGP